jgi:hypothetical protein
MLAPAVTATNILTSLTWERQRGCWRALRLARRAAGAQLVRRLHGRTRAHAVCLVHLRVFGLRQHVLLLVAAPSVAHAARSSEQDARGYSDARRVCVQRIACTHCVHVQHLDA